MDSMPRRSYQHYCAIGRSLDVVGDRWNLLIVRELCGGPRRYSDLFADLPGISTDVLAARLRDLEADGVLMRRRMAPRASAAVYELTEDGHRLRPVLAALSDWGTDRLGDRGSKDAVRAHWLALPLARAIADRRPDATVNVHLGGEPPFHILCAGGQIEYRDGEVAEADAELHLDVDTAVEIVLGKVDAEI